MNNTKVCLVSVLALAASSALAAGNPAGSQAAADNSKRNQRDSNSSNLTPVDQSAGSARDVELTRRIRERLIKDKSLSTNAHNVKIITLNGVATLRGPVESALERTKVSSAAGAVVGTGSVRNQLDVKTSN